MVVAGAMQSMAVDLGFCRLEKKSASSAISLLFCSGSRDDINMLQLLHIMVLEITCFAQ